MGTAAHEMPPRQLLPPPPEPPPFDSLPVDILTDVLGRLAGADSGSPAAGSRALARSRFSEGSRACRQAANEFLNQNAEICYSTSARRLEQAVTQPGPWHEEMAAAVRGLDHVSFQPGGIGAGRLGDALLRLREHAPLRGLEVDSGRDGEGPFERPLAGVLHAHKDSLKDLKLDLKLVFSEVLTEAVASLGHLESLRLKRCHPMASEASCQKLADALGSLRSLRSIDVTDFNGVAKLTTCLPQLLHLQSLRIRRLSSARREDWHAVAKNLQGLQAAKQASAATGTTALRCLGLSGMEAGDRGIVPLAPVLSTISGLHDLDLAANDIRPAGMALLADSLRGMGELQILNLSNNRLHGEGISHLAGALKDLPQLKDLRLYSSRLDADDMRRLGDALPSSTRLRSLTLGRNDLNGCRAADWAALLGSRGLERLDLSSCSLGPQDMALLATGLAACSTLKYLDLGFNDARTTEAAQALADGLKCLPQLETCLLPELGKDGLEKLLPALQALQDSSLKKVFMDFDDTRLVAELQSMPPGLEVL